MRLSVVIATKDRAEYLARALESFSLQREAPDFEVIVFDNGSADATAQVVEQARTRYAYRIEYVWEARPNRGAARNRGIAAAAGELALFCDDDVFVPPSFVAAHAAAHTGDTL